MTVEGELGPAGSPSARLTAVRELSIMGLGSPLQDIALVEPAGVPGGDGDGDEESAAAAAPPQANGVGNGTVSGPDVDGSGKAGRDPSWPQLTVATKQRPAGVATPAVAAGGGAVPQQCVLLRAGGIMSTLDMQEGTEVLLSDAVERFWLPVSAAAAAPGRVSSSASLPLASAGGSAAATPATLSASNSTAALARQSSGAEAPPGAAAAAVAELATRQQEQQQQQQPPRVEMPWWTYGARGMQVPPRRTTLVAFAFDLANTQTARTHPTYPRLPPPQLWFPSSPLEPLTPSLRAPHAPHPAPPSTAHHTHLLQRLPQRLVALCSVHQHAELANCGAGAGGQCVCGGGGGEGAEGGAGHRQS